MQVSCAALISEAIASTLTGKNHLLIPPSCILLVGLFFHFIPHTRMSCNTPQWNLTKKNLSCRQECRTHALQWSHCAARGMSHVTHINESRCTYEWVMAHVSMSHGTHMNESWHTYEWVMAHIWMSHAHMSMSHDTHMTETWRTYEWVMAHTWMSHGTHLMRHVTRKGSFTFFLVISYRWMSHDKHMNESWHTYEWVMAHISCVMSHVRGPQYFL